MTPRATAQLVNELVEAADERQLSRLVDRYGRLNLLLLDELGYVQIDPARRRAVPDHHRTRGAPRSASGPISRSVRGARPSPTRLAAAIVDRVTSNAHILETGTESYRLRTSKTTARPKRAS